MEITRRPVDWLDAALRLVLTPVPRHLGSTEDDRRLFAELSGQLQQARRHS